MISIGINYSQMHDSSACIARDGKVLFAVAEERMSRIKHDARFRELAIGACLDFAGVQPKELDYVCFGWPPVSASVRHDLKCMFRGVHPVDYVSVATLFRRYMSIARQHNGEKPFLERFSATKAKIRFVDHHLAHAISAYSYSGFDEAAVLVLDGRGAWEATSLWRGRDGSSNTSGRFRGPIRWALLRAVHALSRL